MRDHDATDLLDLAVIISALLLYVGTGIAACVHQ